MPHLTPIRRCLPWPGCARAGVGSSGHVGPSPGWFLCSAELLLLRAEGHWKFINLGRRDLAGRRIRAGSPGPGLPSQAGAVGPGALCEAWTCPWAGGAREAPPTHQRAASWKSRPRQRLKGGRKHRSALGSSSTSAVRRCLSRPEGCLALRPTCSSHYPPQVAPGGCHTTSLGSPGGSGLPDAPMSAQNLCPGHALSRRKLCKWAWESRL